MKTRRYGWHLASWVPAFCFSLQVQAFQLSGSFTGTAAASALPVGFEPPTPISFFDGAAVSGSFVIDVPHPQFQVGDGDSAYFLNGNDGTFAMSFTVHGRNFDYAVNSPPDDPSVLLLANSSTAQSLTVLTTFIPKYEGAWLTLSGPSGSLFSGLDATTLHLDATRPYAFGASFRDYSSALGLDVNAADVHLNTTTPVPEPTTVSLLLLGGALLAGAARKRAVPQAASYAI